MRRNSFIFFITLLLISCVTYSFIYVKRVKNWQVLEQDIKKDCSIYKIDVNFDPKTKIITANQEIFIKNNFDKSFSQLYFHIYPNAFQNIDTTPFPKEDIKLSYPNGFSPGKMEIKKISDKKGPLKYNINGTILEVALNEPIKPQENLKIFIEFKCILPPSQGRFGYGENTFNIANWYPILAVYDENGWHKDPYYKIGDPFYSDIALYDVNIQVPKDYTVAATGSLVSKEVRGNHAIWEYKSDLVRDFAFVISDKFDVVEDKTNKTKVKSYFLKGDKNGKKALEYATGALEVFSRLFGKYPYGDYCVVSSDFYIGGMEYPNIVIIGKEFYEDLELLEYIIVHETAHQWWYGLVGNDQVNEAWLDEALAEYSTILYYEDVYGKKVGEDMYNQAILNPYKFYEMVNPPGHILRPLSQFEGWQDYSILVYSKGAIMLKELERRMGKGQFLKALKIFYKNNVYKNATTEDFIEVINHVTGTDWTDFIYKWLKGGNNVDMVS